MGVIIHRRVINVYDIPDDFFGKCLGRGLCEGGDEYHSNIETDLGQGLAFDGNAFGVRTGPGLKIDEENRVAAHVGRGLNVEGGRIHLDTCRDGCPGTFTVLSDSHLSLDGPKLVLTKDFTRYSVWKNAAGLVLDIEVDSTFSTSEDVTLCVPHGYNYGYSCARAAKPLRNSTADFPNFYLK